jgi:multimeric flavodoxin WrbA
MNYEENVLMSKKILVLAGSPRKGGNTDRLSDEFIRGAREAGAESEKIYLKNKKIGGCLGCFACQKNSGICVQKDDMGELYEKMKAADVIVFASPVYFYTWNAQMKTVIDRTIAVSTILINKTFYMISAGQAPTEEYMGTMIDSFRKYIGCFRGEGNKEGGYVFAYGVDKPGDVIGTPAMEQAYEMGRKV